ncbi:DUF2062 domain-containing protein [Hymenobacter sp. H14-R3]|uniref:DUF2062 domain-containing protein n=1 Tax=Hymenobacter sp. H14-R3 TaxID=3046308 RepID=UPI0024BA6F8B|nr:DUF2062 domain-containing protein [Hymenobacter sp. H14-R3]MDJ0367020.1 DUF2062 domain-containing protein [Hymenobacter sp. H14-R3]
MTTTSTSATGVRAAPGAPPRTWIQRRLTDPFLSLLKAGLSPGSLALTAGLGVAFGLAPTFGVTTLISTAVALRLKLNVAAMQLVCHVLSPLQILLFLPLLRWGATLLGHGREVAHLNLGQIKTMVKADGWGQVLHLLWRAELGALLIWGVAAVPVVFVLYVSLRPIFRRFITRHEEAEAAEAKTS